MIARITGELLSLDDEKALVSVGNISYEVMLPGYCVSSLSSKIGTEITLCTMEYYEGTPGGGNLIPRMVGFMNSSEKEFFLKYTSVKGMGIKKGLKSLCLPVDAIASAIESGDEKIVISMPGIGKRLAQHIIAELSGKLSGYASDLTMSGQSEISGQGAKFSSYQIETLEILVAWGEKRNEAIELVKLASQKHPDIKTAEELVPIVYRLKQGAEV
ncbi:MAG: Holliday junction branch migration protein RuvA [Sedimentisphaeraceae bacterium JB056]